MVNLAMSIFEFLTKFLVFWHPWVRIRSVCWKCNLKQIEAIPTSVKSTLTPKFLGTAEAYFVCHIGPNFQISLIYAFIGCP